MTGPGGPSAAGAGHRGATSVQVLPDGRTLRLGFPGALARPPATLAGHLAVTVGGAAWPVGAATPDPADPGAVLVALDEPVVGGRAGDAGVELGYDGAGGLTDADGRPVERFVVHGPNRSLHQLRTRWADEVGPDNALPEYPRPQLTRDRWRNLNGTWEFAAATADEPPPVGRPPAGRILVPYPVESQLSGVRRHLDRMWYRRTFTVPPDWRIGAGHRLRLNFGAVDWHATVYVNGVLVADHRGGYDRFHADVTDALRPGGGAQELIVGVHDPTEAADGPNPPLGKQRVRPGNGVFYTPSSGIWQTVWLEPVPVDHVDSLRITPDVAGELVTVEARGVRAGLPLHAVVRHGGAPVAEATGRTGGPLTLRIPEPRLWSPDDPFLYDLRVTVGAGPDRDTVDSYFGMRTVAVRDVDGVPRIVLNGRPVFLMATLDQGFWPDGLYTAPTDQALAHDLRMHKRMGFNSVRKHLKVEPDRWFAWADRLGLLVWQDMPSTVHDRTPDAAARAQFERELALLVDQHANSPSLVVWVVFNEGWGQYDQARLADLVASLDRTRLVDAMSGTDVGDAVDGGNGHVSDGHGYPSPTLPAPDGRRALVSGEYGGLGLAVPGHSWPVRASYGDVDAAGHTDAYLARLAEVRALAARGGSGAVHTQITDVEGELNGLLTYDREVVKPDVERLAAAHRELLDAVADGTLTAAD